MISSMWNLLRTSQHPYVGLLYIGAPYGTRIASLFTAADNSIRKKKKKKESPAFLQLKYQGHFQHVHQDPTDPYHTQFAVFGAQLS